MGRGASEELWTTGSTGLSTQLSLESHPKAPRPFAECLLAALKDIAHGLANIGVFESTSDITYWR
jgi:hypothetical protein